MGLTFTVAILCIIYYIINKYYPHYITWHINYGFIGLIILYLVIQYLINFEYPFVYKTMKNIYNSIINLYILLILQIAILNFIALILVKIFY